MSQIEDSVCADIQTRSDFGAKKYGVTMERTDLSEIQWLQHAYEEALDLAVYLKKIILEREEEKKRKRKEREERKKGSSLTGKTLIYRPYADGSGDSEVFVVCDTLQKAVCVRSGGTTFLCERKKLILEKQNASN